MRGRGHKTGDNKVEGHKEMMQQQGEYKMDKEDKMEGKNQDNSKGITIKEECIRGHQDNKSQPM